MNSLNKIISERFSCRSYDTERIPERELLLAVIESARLAPSACNRQPWKFMILTAEGDREKVVAAYDRGWIKSAPAYIVALGNHDEAWHRASDGKDHTDVDIAIAVEHICLSATALGLGTCWVCNFDAEALRKACNIPAEFEPIAIIPIGYPAADCKHPEKVRKSLEEIIQWGSF